ncbi:MAG: nucleotide exchange factor GrpE [Planctomycetota bacterium]|jgi:molecular chaperone GrpE
MKKSKSTKKAENKDGGDDMKVSKEVRKLTEQIDELSKEKDDLFEKLQRVGADYANYQKRAPRQIADSVAYEKKAIIRSLLPSLDNFAHALAGADTAETVDGVVKGVRMVFEHMLDALKAHGLEQIDAVGKEFDPNIHEAIQLRADADQPDNVVLEDFQTGYKLNGQVVRPSKVIVNKLPAEEKQAEQAGDGKSDSNDVDSEE